MRVQTRGMRRCLDPYSTAESTKPRVLPINSFAVPHAAGVARALWPSEGMPPAHGGLQDIWPAAADAARIFREFHCLQDKLWVP